MFDVGLFDIPGLNFDVRASNSNLDFRCSMVEFRVSIFDVRFPMRKESRISQTVCFRVLASLSLLTLHDPLGLLIIYLHHLTCHVSFISTPCATTPTATSTWFLYLYISACDDRSSFGLGIESVGKSDTCLNGARFLCIGFAPVLPCNARFD